MHQDTNPNAVRKWLRDLWGFAYRSDTFPQKQVGQLWDTTFGKVVAVLSVGELLNINDFLPLGLITTLNEFLMAYTAYLNGLQ